MKIIVYGSKTFEKKYIINASQGKHELCFVLDKLSLHTVDQAIGHEGVSCFVADYINETLMTKLTENGIKYITLRSGGYDYARGVGAKRHNERILKDLNLRHNQLLNLGSAKC